MEHLIEADTSVEDDSQWTRLTELFDLLLAGADQADVLASEPDPEIRKAAEDLWLHHLSAGQDDFLGGAMAFSVLPMFEAGQVLLNRFEIERMLGRGGMGEVYLALDRRVEERVALKTVARLLAPSPSIRRRILAEVQSARRVTHPNVCRIHELFDDGETVFFTMEYVRGQLLTDVIAHLKNPGHARLLVRQMAEGLHAAHKTGVVHGDFKPGNVMVAPGEIPRAVVMDFGLARALDRAASSPDPTLSVQAGTADYMAPELHSGAQPTVRSDVFAFGKVARQLMPKERMWDECARTHPEDRPASIEPVLRRLNSSTTRRYWIAGTAVASAAVLRYASLSPGRRSIMLPTDTRILVNGFQAVADQLPGARLVRALFLTALQQSPRIRAIADQDLLPALRRLTPGENLPLAGELLQGLLAQVRAAYWIDGDLRQAGGRYSLNVRLLRASDQQIVMESAFRDQPGIVNLAQQAAVWLRKESGESTQSMAANPADVGSYTSEVPEALQKYYDAMEHYAEAELEHTIALLREAIRLDPNFAQAHAMLGRVDSAARNFEEGHRELELAMQLAHKLPDRERTAIEAAYYRMLEDPDKTIEAARKEVAYYPDEPRCLMALGMALVNAGQAEEAIPICRKAIELAPGDWMQVLRLEDAMAQAGQFDAALQEFQVGLAKGVRNKWLYGAAGSAYIGLERYDDAVAAFENEPPDEENAIDVQSAKIMQGHLDLAIAAMEEHRARARSIFVSHWASEFLCGLYYMTDRPQSAIQHLREMVDLPAYPKMAHRLACTASWACRLKDYDALSTVQRKTSEIAQRWPNALTRAVEMHAMALESWRKNSFEDAEGLLLQSLGSAYSVWTLFDLAEFFTSRAKFELAEEYWRKFEERKGTLITPGWFPGILVLGWLHRAMVAQARNDRSKAYKYSQKVLDHWGQTSPRLQVVLMARNVNAVTKPL